MHPEDFNGLGDKNGVVIRFSSVEEIYGRTFTCLGRREYSNSKILFSVRCEYNMHLFIPYGFVGVAKQNKFWVFVCLHNKKIIMLVWIGELLLPAFVYGTAIHV